MPSVTETLQAKLGRLRARAEVELDRLVPRGEARPARLHAAMRHSLEAGGKRLRPVLVAAAAEVFGGPDDPWPAAAAVECVHTYSLIHDDLPAMDDSDLRRGRPSCHKAFDEATAILAGDALLPLAFEILATRYRPGLAAPLVAELAVAAGSLRLVAGQMEDLEAEGRAASPDELRFIHANKTGALLVTSLRLGARIGGADEAELGIVTRAGEHLGLAFQIVDDILDATSDAATLGKTAGGDAAAGKNTYVKVHGLETARAEALRESRLAAEAFGALRGDVSFLRDLSLDLATRVR